MSPRRFWQASELEVLRDLYSDVPAADVAALLARPVGQVHQTAARYGLSKSAHFRESDLSGRIKRGKQLPSIVATQFKLGIVPWNKGASYMPGGRCVETQFKPGRAPHEARNYAPIGSLRVSKEGYLERKITDNPALAPTRRWTAVHRLVWIDTNGPIPDGHIITFRPGCKTNTLEIITADKLECISRAENARRNHPNSSNPELAKLVQLKGAITRQVNRISRLSEQGLSK